MKLGVAVWGVGVDSGSCVAVWGGVDSEAGVAVRGGGEIVKLVLLYGVGGGGAVCGVV